MRALMKDKPAAGAVLKEIDPPKIGDKDLLVKVIIYPDPMAFRDKFVHDE